MSEIPNWVVQVAAVWFLLEKVAFFEKWTKEWANRRAYEKARKENAEAYDAGAVIDIEGGYSA